jgi:hypothetical protein
MVMGAGSCLCRDMMSVCSYTCVRAGVEDGMGRMCRKVVCCGVMDSSYVFSLQTDRRKLSFSTDV